MDLTINQRARECARDLWDEMDRINRVSGEYGQATQSFPAQEQEWRRLVELIVMQWFRDLQTQKSPEKAQGLTAVGKAD